MTRRVGIALVAVAIAAAAAVPSYHVTITGAAGQRLWTVPAGPGAPVTLVYENSIYRAPTRELLVATAQGFTLREVRSTNQAVLAYNGLEAPYARDGRWFVAPASTVLSALPLRIGRTGRQYLIVSGRTVPLYEAGEGARLVVEVERAPRAIAALRAWTLR